VGGVAGKDGAQQVIAAGQVERDFCLALGVERQAGHLPVVVEDGDGA
jgi:hypothetical protein